jgi:hypothetical protein
LTENNERTFNVNENIVASIGVSNVSKETPLVYPGEVRVEWPVEVRGNNEADAMEGDMLDGSWGGEPGAGDVGREECFRAGRRVDVGGDWGVWFIMKACM